MIKNEKKLRELLRIDNNIGQKELEIAADEIFEDLKLIINTSNEEIVKEIAKKKLKLLSEVYEKTETNYDVKELNFDDVYQREMIACRHVREALMLPTVSFDKLENLRNGIKIYTSAEALYLQAVLIIRTMEHRDVEYERIAEAEELIINACAIEPENLLYKEVASGISEIRAELIMIKNQIKEEKKRLADEEARRKEQELEEKRRIAQQRLDEKKEIALAIAGTILGCWCACKSCSYCVEAVCCCG